IRVIRENGQPVGFLEVFIRNIIRIVDLIVGPYFVLFSKKEKRLGDYAIGTIVVKEKEITVPLVDTEIPDDFKSDIPNISKLSPKDFTLIGSFLKRKDSFEHSSRDNLLNEFLTFYFNKLSLNNVYNIDDIEELSYEEKLSWLVDIYNAYKARGNISQSIEGVS
ncbi:MAG: RDD family protein, partial [Cyanobacteriota bacterium]